MSPQIGVSPVQCTEHLRELQQLLEGNVITVEEFVEQNTSNELTPQAFLVCLT